MSDKDEILITHEFSFEDIPEGIPLEDPLYDNLTRDKEKNGLRKKDNINTNAYDGDSPDNEDINNSDSTNDSDSNINPSDQPIYTNLLPYNPNTNQEISPMRNILFSRNNMIEATKNFQQRHRVQIDDKLDLDNKANQRTTKNLYRNIVIRAGGNDVVKTTFNSGNKQIDLLYKSFDESDNVQIDKEEVSSNEIKDKTTRRNHNERQRSINAEVASKNILPNNTSNDPNSGNDINRQTMPNHIIEVRDEHKSNPQVDNPLLADFHVIDTEKDLEVPSGLEGPIPVVVLPPMSFQPPKHFSPPERFEISDNVPKTPLNGVPNYFGPQDGVRNNIFNPQDSLINYFAPQNTVSNYAPHNSRQNNFGAQNFSPNSTPQNAQNHFNPQKPNSNNFALQNPVPNGLTSQNAPYYDPQNFVPDGYSLNKPNYFLLNIKPNNFASRNSPTTFSSQNVVQRNFAPQNAPTNFASLNAPTNYAPQSYLPQNFAPQYSALNNVVQPSRHIVPPPPTSTK